MGDDGVNGIKGIRRTAAVAVVFPRGDGVVTGTAVARYGAAPLGAAASQSAESRA